MLDRVARLLQSVTQIGADPADPDELRLRKMVGVTSVAMGGIPMILGYGLLFLCLHEPAAGWSLICGSVLMFLGMVAFSRSRNFAFYNIYWLFITNMSAFVATVCLGGFQRDGLFTFWGIVTPLIATITNKPKYAVGWFLAYALEIVVMTVGEPLLRHANNLTPSTTLILSAINLICFSGFVLCIVLFFVLKQDFLLKLVREEKARSEALLLNILPKEIADRLKNEQRLIADGYPNVSILFADIVGFTPLSEKMQPIELVALLNEVFSYFDSLVEEYGLEKIKTIGDCYMVAAGVPRQRADHAQVLTRMALRIQEQMQTRTFGQSHRLLFRIGINSGPAVAGVIGHKKFIYDLWGDAVNTASRMESHGSAGTVQITQATHDLIAKDFVCEARGSIPIKGKGEMSVWIVKAERSA
jgi:guanylate cyclase